MNRAPSVSATGRRAPNRHNHRNSHNYLHDYLHTHRLNTSARCMAVIVDDDHVIMRKRSSCCHCCTASVKSEHIAESDTAGGSSTAIDPTSHQLRVPGSVGRQLSGRCGSDYEIAK